MNRRTIAVARAEFLQIARDPRTIIWIFGLPALMLLLFGYAITLDVKMIPTVVLDPSPSSESRAVLSTIESSGYFKVVEKSTHVRLDEDLFIHGFAKLAVIFPVDFSRNYARKKAVSIQAIVDGADNNTAMIGLGYLQKILNAYNIDLIATEAIKSGSPTIVKPALSTVTRVWYNPELKSRPFIIPGLIANILGMLNVIITALCIIRERERGTFEQLIVTPLQKWELIIGKLIPYYILGILQFILVLVVSRYFFDVPIKGSLIDVFLITFIFLAASLGQGLLISIVSSSQAVAMQAGIITSMLPGFILSGFMFPVESMPRVIQYLAAIVPARYFLEVLRTLMIKGVSIWEIPLKTVFLLIVVALFFAVSYKKLHRFLE